MDRTDKPVAPLQVLMSPARACRWHTEGCACREGVLAHAAPCQHNYLWSPSVTLGAFCFCLRPHSGQMLVVSPVRS